MRVSVITALCLLIAPALLAYDTPLAEVRNLDCAFKRAVRFDQSATTQGSPGGPTAYIKIVATGANPGNCDVNATLHIRTSGGSEKELVIGHNTNDGFDIVDWSPGSSLVLVSSEHWTHVFSAPVLTVYDVRHNTHREIDIRALFASKGWVNCSAIVDATGFTPSGEIVVQVGPGAYKTRPKDCTSGKSYWAFDLRDLKLHELESGFKQRSYGKVSSPEIRPCKEDPGIVDSCFDIHGRISYTNGTPDMRIWRIGTSRMLGVFDPENQIIPENLSKELTGFGVEVYGDFEVCPFTKQKPGEMQMVCVESANHLVTKRY
jgi:hypothetical protein